MREGDNGGTRLFFCHSRGGGNPVKISLDPRFHAQEQKSSVRTRDLLSLRPETASMNKVGKRACGVCISFL